VAESYELGEQALTQIARGLRKLNAIPIPSPETTRRQQRFSVGSSGIGVYNTSGETVPAFGVMRIVSATTLGTEVVYEIGKQATEFQRFMLVNGEETIADNAYGTGYFLDLAGRVLYDSADGTPALGQVWGPYPSSWKLRRHMYGFRILGDADTNGTHVRCLQHLVTHVFGKTNGAYSKGATNAALSVWKGDASADSTADVTSAHIPYAAAGNAKWGEIVWHSETPRFTALEC
jgi:hypothetical protein